MLRILVPLSMLALAGCGQPGEWTGFVYPDQAAYEATEARGGTYRPIVVQGLSSFTECQETTIGVLRKQANPDAGSYECGRQCRWNPSIQQNVCKETRK